MIPSTLSVASKSTSGSCSTGAKCCRSNCWTWITRKPLRMSKGPHRLVQWCGLEWEPACLQFHTGTRPVRTASVAQVRQPIYRRSVARWKHYEESLGALFARL